MKKGGQVTIFIIIAVLLIAMGVIFFVFKDNFGFDKDSLEIAPIQEKVISCLEITSEEGIIYIALRGGYYEIPEGVLMSYYTDEAPYYYINSKLNIPTLSRIERELENYMKVYLEDCINLSSFEEQGFNIRKGNLSVSADIEEDKINAKANYPLVITKEESTSRLSEFKVEINSNAEKLRLASEEIVNSYSQNPGFVCLTCLEDISNKYDVQAKATPLPDTGVIWFSVSDSESELNWKFVVEE